MTHTPYAPGSQEIRRDQELSRIDHQPYGYGAQALAEEAKVLQQRIDELLEQFSSSDIASCLQRSHNALPADQRGGCEMQIRLLSPEFQQGGYDACY